MTCGWVNRIFNGHTDHPVEGELKMISTQLPAKMTRQTRAKPPERKIAQNPFLLRKLDELQRQSEVIVRQQVQRDAVVVMPFSHD